MSAVRHSPAPDERLQGGRRRRVLVAKPGLDGHDRGLKVIARVLRDAGFEVVYTGMRQTAAAIARSALQEDVSVVGLSILSGAHMKLCGSVLRAMREEGLEDVAVIVGGTIPAADVQPLRDLGIAAVFGVTSTLDEVRVWFEQNA